MEGATKISLLDLTTQLSFEIDNAIKNEICFGESLIISCGHNEGYTEDEESDSDWSCDDTTEREVSEKNKRDEIFEVKDKAQEEIEIEEKYEEDENDFHFFFFPDCAKPLPPVNSKASIIMVNGLPQINPDAAKGRIVCTCPIDKKGECECFTKLPCKCGAKTQATCTCAQLKEICICHDGLPNPTCTCGSRVCVCLDKLQPSCTCDKIENPCICGEKSGKFPSPICNCKFKPKFIKEQSLHSIHEETEMIVAEEENEIIEEEPCTCQKMPTKRRCFCLIEKDCTCKDNTCICSVRKPCICGSIEDEEIVSESYDNVDICDCKPLVCTCGESLSDCKCFPKKKLCTCGDPDNCKCHFICDCIDPCICDTAIVESLECTCLKFDKSKLSEVECTCDGKQQGDKKLKRIRAGKHGYRWCHDVDPHHTYFDYSYIKRDKMTTNEPDVEKFKILGLHDKKEDEVCAVHGIQAPPFKKKIRKPSIDCCSTVGGISISVETLGEEKDKFLVQVVSNSSKEGAKCGTKLVSILDCNLHTMEENRSEHITKRDITKELKSYIAICESGYYNKLSRICGERKVIKRHYHTFEDAKDFLLEGANVVLLRYFGLRRHRGNVKTNSVTINGTICESIYVCNGVSQAIVNGKPMFVVKVERHIIEPSGYITQTLTVLTLRGYIVSHEWADSCYLFHINPLLNIIPERDEIESHVPLRERWREDIQLLSDYLDFKSTRTSEGGRYVTESGALTGTVRDYLQTLLLLRPHDALNFTRHYFSAALSALDLPHDDYFDPNSKRVRYYFFED